MSRGPVLLLWTSRWLLLVQLENLVFFVFMCVGDDCFPKDEASLVCAVRPSWSFLQQVPNIDIMST
jgi:hypothetical protein